MNTPANARTMTEDQLKWSGEYQPHPAGIWNAELSSVEVVTSAEEYGSKPRVKMSFTTEAEMESGEPFSISVFSAPSLDPRAKIRPFLQALGEDIPAAQKAMAEGTFRVSSYIGRQVIVVVEQEPRKDGQGVRSVVKSFQPRKKKAAARPKPSFDDDEE